jgi:glycosyltransferase involved in cell wall biosynthesis
MRTSLDRRVADSEDPGVSEPAVARRALHEVRRDSPLAPAAAPSGTTARVLVVSSHFPPERGAGVHRILRIVNQLGADDWPVSVLTLDPRHYRPGTPVDDGLLDRVPAAAHVYRTGALRVLVEAAKLRRRLLQSARGIGRRLFGRAPAAPASASAGTKPPAPAKRPFIDAEIGWLLPAVHAGARAVARHRPDVIFSSAPPFTCHLIAGWLARRHGIRWVADFRDPWARSPWGGAALANSWRGRLRVWLERLVIERADAVVLNTPPLRDDFVRHYGPRLAHKFHAVTNGFDADVLGPYIGRPPRPSARLVLTHAGSLYRRRDPRPLLRGLAAAIREGRIPADALQLHFVGSVSAEFQMDATIRELGLEGAVRLTPSVPHEKSLEYLAEADVLVAIQPDTHLQVPVKLYEYLPFRKPILALAPAGALRTIAERSGLGLSADADDIEGIAGALAELHEHRQRLGERFRPDSSYIDQFDGAVVARQLQAILAAPAEAAAPRA